MGNICTSAWSQEPRCSSAPPPPLSSSFASFPTSSSSSSLPLFPDAPEGLEVSPL